ncbi:hypothetical protein [Natronobeatus ordinarius]|uniref:hypothetical protein n=1 Tax=Natronobeatus ordinarius TaxID=2963433 RepID=UPI0020CE4498|nr:hypothetical protein [Natronobeatus ordinarius]
MARPSRRTILAGATAAVAVSLAGCSEPRSDEPDADGEPPTDEPTADDSPPVDDELDEDDVFSVGNLSIEGWNAIDLVERGADPTGEECLTGVLEENAADETLLVLPSGRYRMDEGFTASDLRNVGVIGTGATITLGPDFADESAFELGSSGSVACENVLFGGLEYDFTDANAGAAIFTSYCEGFARIEDLRVFGAVDGAAAASRTVSLRLQENDASIGRAHVDRIRCPDGGATAGVWLQPETELCHVHVTDSVVANFEDNGFYADTGDGQCTFERCLARNNSVSNFRLGGVVRDSRVVLDDEFAHEPVRPRGFWMRSTPGRIENCTLVNAAHREHALEVQDADCVVDGLDVTMTDEAGGTAIRIYDAGEYRTTVRNARLAFDGTDANALVRIDNDGTTIDELTIRSDAPSGHPIRVHEASNTTIVGLDVESTDEGSDAMRFDGAAAGDAVVRDSRLDVAGAAADLEVAAPDVRLENVDAEVAVTDDGVRATVDGVGTNDGDPSVTGAWNGNATPGVFVEDTEAGDVYLTLGEEWRRLG